MRVAILLRDLSNGGMQSSAMKLVTGMPEISDVILLRDLIEYELPTGRFLHILGCDRMGGRIERLVCFSGAVKQLGNLLKLRQIDVILSFGFSMNVVAVFACRILRNRPAVICGIRNSSSEYRENGSRWSLLPWLVPLTSRWADGLIANSRALKAELIHNGIPAEKVAVVHNGYDLDAIRNLAGDSTREQCVQSENLPVIVFVGRFSLQKNLPLLLNAFHLVLHKIPAKLVMVGDGEESGNVRRMISRLGIEDRVQCVGKKNNPYSYMRGASLLVLSSVFEGFPNVLIEAMACGTPVVAVDCPHGPAEILSGGGGILVPFGSAEALAAAIVKVFETPGLRDELSKNAIRRAGDFDIAAMVSNTRNAMRLFTGVCSGMVSS